MVGQLDLERLDLFHDDSQPNQFRDESSVGYGLTGQLGQDDQGQVVQVREEQIILAAEQRDAVWVGEFIGGAESVCLSADTLKGKEAVRETCREYFAPKWTNLWLDGLSRSLQQGTLRLLLLA